MSDDDQQVAQTAAFAGVTGEAYIAVLGGAYPGYVVAVPLPDLSGAVLRRCFHGIRASPAVHLQRAVRWRDAAYKRLYGGPPPVRAFHDRQANSVTDIPGVRYQIKRVHSRPDPQRIYQVAVFIAVVFIAEVWLDPGKDGRRPTRSAAGCFPLPSTGTGMRYGVLSTGARAWSRRSGSAKICPEVTM